MHDNLRSQKLAYSAPRFTLMARPRQDVESRFWSKVEKTDSCWIWRGTLDSDGFGVFKLPKATNGEWWAPWSGTNVQAHIFSALFADFRFADGHYLRHVCNNRACVNVAHLESCAPVDVQPSGVDQRGGEEAEGSSTVGARGVGQRHPEGSEDHRSTETEIGAGDSLHRCDSAGRSNRTTKTAAYSTSDLVPGWGGDTSSHALRVNDTGVRSGAEN